MKAVSKSKAQAEATAEVLAQSCAEASEKAPARTPAQSAARTPARTPARAAASKNAALPPFGDVISVMGRTLGAANRYLVELMAQEGIGGIVPSHGDILMQLFAHDAMPMAALASAIGKDPSTVTALVRKLAEAGYVEKVPNARDRRVCEVRLTKAGQALRPAMNRVSDELIATLTNGIPAADLAATYRTMKAMQKNVSATAYSETERTSDSEPES